MSLKVPIFKILCQCWNKKRSEIVRSSWKTESQWDQMGRRDDSPQVIKVNACVRGGVSFKKFLAQRYRAKEEEEAWATTGHGSELVVAQSWRVWLSLCPSVVPGQGGVMMPKAGYLGRHLRAVIHLAAKGHACPEGQPLTGTHYCQHVSSLPHSCQFRLC